MRMETQKNNRENQTAPPLNPLDARLKSRYLAKASSVERLYKPRRSNIPPTHTNI